MYFLAERTTFVCRSVKLLFAFSSPKGPDPAQTISSSFENHSFWFFSFHFFLYFIYLFAANLSELMAIGNALKASITLTPLYGPSLIGAGLRSRKQLKHISV